MSHISESDLNTLTQFNLAVIFTGHQPLNNAIGIFQSVERLTESHGSTSLSLPVVPLSLLHLDMSAIPKHYVTQVCTCLGRIHPAPEAFGIQKRQHTGMVHMSMCQKNIINERCLHRQRSILVQINTLLHTIINQYVLTTCVKIMTTARNLMSSSDKH